MNNNFTIYCDRLMTMKKAEIIREGQDRGFWADRESNTKYLMKSTKIMLARYVADRMVRMENRGY